MQTLTTEEWCLVILSSQNLQKAFERKFLVTLKLSEPGKAVQNQRSSVMFLLFLTVYKQC